MSDNQKMKTRSQTKKEKLDNQNSKIPHLNEAILGIILRHVVRKEQNEILECLYVIRNHFVFHVEPGLDLLEDLYATSVDDHVTWPDYLNSNSRRLIYHTNVKLFPNQELSIHISLSLRLTTKRELDLLWKTFKHFGEIQQRWDDRGNYEEFEAADYFQRLWKMIRARPAARDSLFEKLEKRMR